MAQLEHWAQIIKDIAAEQNYKIANGDNLEF